MSIYGYTATEGPSLRLDLSTIPCPICNGYIKGTDECSKLDVLKSTGRVYYCAAHTACYEKLTPEERKDIILIGLQAIMLDSNNHLVLQSRGMVN